MKDLYRNLNIDGPIDDPTLLKRAINRGDDVGTVRAANFILLNPKRKQFYDRNHRVLSIIGQLRARLALPRSYEWDALGNQDFECRTSNTCSDWLDSLDELDPLGGVSLDAPVHHLHGRTYSNWIDPIHIALGVIAVACVCLLLAVFAVLKTPTADLPENGFVVRYAEAPADSRIEFQTRKGAGHYFVKIVSGHDKRLVMTVFLRDGEDATVDVASGNYELRISVGKASDWDGRRFRRQLREIEAPEITVRPGQTWKVPIP